jgi:hypothetical protein
VHQVADLIARFKQEVATRALPEKKAPAPATNAPPKA